MKKLFLIFSIISFSHLSFSQTKKELIKELFIAMKQDSIMEVMGKSMVQGMLLQSQMINKNKSQMLQKSVERLDQIAEANKISELSIVYFKKFIIDDLVSIYDNHFTDYEIKDFIQFYKSASGQKFLNISPKLQAETMLILMQKYLPQIMQEMEIGKGIEK